MQWVKLTAPKVNKSDLYFTIINHHQLIKHKHNFMLTISCQNQRQAKPKIIEAKKLGLKFNATLAER
jgi:hypothetical protein